MLHFIHEEGEMIMDNNGGKEECIGQVQRTYGTRRDKNALAISELKKGVGRNGLIHHKGNYHGLASAGLDPFCRNSMGLLCISEV